MSNTERDYLKKRISEFSLKIKDASTEDEKLMYQYRRGIAYIDLYKCIYEKGNIKDNAFLSAEKDFAYIIQNEFTSTKMRAEAHQAKADLYLLTKRYKEAILEYEKAIKNLAIFAPSGKSDGIDSCNFQIGICYEEIGDKDTALDYYNKVSENLKDYRTPNEKFEKAVKLRIKVIKSNQ